ncbi:MAG: hypothetical protein HY865_22485 [Chloroflexi bacterium]|nr:hypothetical protein [Chloroflexota bacterium]
MDNDNTITNIFISIMLVTALVGYDIAHSPTLEVKAQDNVVVVPSPTAAPEETTEDDRPIKSGIEWELSKQVKVKVSNYWPEYGGINCLTFKDGKCVSKMANGETWESGVNTAIACPKELKLGTQINILGKVWTCKDRGSMIVKTKDDEYWVDMLTKKPVVNYGKVVTGEIVKEVNK